LEKLPISDVVEFAFFDSSSGTEVDTPEVDAQEVPCITFRAGVDAGVDAMLDDLWCPYSRTEVRSRVEHV
jgi:hypothetical protein